jgi:hypothetical protein
MPASRGTDSGCCVYFETASTLPVVKPRAKRSMLPILTFLFLLSYGLMVLLVVEQNRTITSQRWVITELMSDSRELSSLKRSLVIEHHDPKPVAPKNQTHIPSHQATPSPQATPAPKNHSDSSARYRRNSPEHPPRLTSDTPDVRRAVNSI